MSLSVSANRTAALIVAAGRGTRVANDGLAKQYLLLGDRSVLGWSLETFLHSAAINLVQVVIHPDDVPLYEGVVARLDDTVATKLLPPVFGGATRQDSSAAGLTALKSHDPSHVLIHDAARPFLTEATIEAVIAAVEPGGSVPALPVVDTLKRATDSGDVGETIAREGLWRAQTPQGFRFDVICAAYAAAGGDDFTDDASIAEAADVAVTLVAGDPSLRKVTTADDLAWAREKVEADAMMETCVGQGFDVHAFGDGDEVVLCGVSIPHDRGLSGHSDADVGLHALTDAILGALCEGDIGLHFPPSDPQWKGADSALFLTDAVARVARRGGRLAHVDVTLICERPKVGPHRDAMAARLASLLGLANERINVKATTTERLGFPGREEGIAAMATATVVLPSAR